MSDEIKVSVNSWGDNRSLALSWTDPIYPGKRKTKSAKNSGLANRGAIGRQAG